MNKDFDFDKIGKRMPYTTPEGFFDKLEDDIWKEVNGGCQEKENDKSAATETPYAGHKPAKLRLLMRSIVAVAASIALVLIVNMDFSGADTATIGDVDEAFGQLTSDDQAYLLDIYQDDIFINE